MGRLLAEKLGLPFYDKVVIKTLQEKYHISPEEIERLKGRKHSWPTSSCSTLKIDHSYFNRYVLNNPEFEQLLGGIFRQCLAQSREWWQRNSHWDRYLGMMTAMTQVPLTFAPDYR